MARKIPATMVSQHPDNASKPYWHSEEFISTQHETFECYLSFSELGVSEYKWDWEGKLVDESIMERLFSQYYEYFKTNPLGYSKFLTFRLPNPKVETEFRIGRAFMGILSADMLARQLGFYNPALFEVILPMTESAREMIEIQEAFREMSGLKHKLYRMADNSLRHIELIPLFEDVHTIINSANILEEYLKMHKRKFKFLPGYLRPYIARSDPALNAGIVPTILAAKIALSRYKAFTEKTGIPTYPVIGSASLPFRGGLTPLTVAAFAEEYKGVRTALLQSAFRYDYERDIVKKAVEQLEKLLPAQVAISIPKEDEKVMIELINLFENFYKPTIEQLADKINTIATSLPRRRERVQHVGLFGYSRGVGKVKLPRAIGFTASMYSLGIPPEMIGTGRGIKAAKEKKLLPVLEKYYSNLRSDLIRAGKFVNKPAIKKLAKTDATWNDVLTDITEVEKYLKVSFEPETEEEKQHKEITDEITRKLAAEESIAKLIEQAAVLRKSLG